MIKGCGINVISPFLVYFFSVLKCPDYTAPKAQVMNETNDNSNKADKALLPAGMSDVLPPEAAFEATISEQLMTQFGAFGFDRVKPPLLEFEQNLLRGPGLAMSEQTFRLMDPVSQRMMGLRADMTPQVSRIASTRLTNAPRPLRLSYAGQILRIKGTQLRAERQFGQVGVELIGANTPLADTEIILLATGALTALGIMNMSVDLCLPTLVPALCDDMDLSGEDRIALRDALDRKDAADLASLADTIGQDNVTIFAKLLAATGPAEDALASLDSLNLEGSAKIECGALLSIVSAISEQAPELPLTLDLIENRGWEYHTGVTFTFFTRGGRGELGTGGRYITSEQEHATGLTLFMDTVLRAIPKRPTVTRLFMPANTPKDTSRKLRDVGWVTVHGLEETSDDKAEARRLNCTHIYEHGGASPLAHMK